MLRDGRTLDLELMTRELSGEGTERALLWAGSVLQDPLREVATQGGIEPSGVYNARYWYGSPANRYGLHATRRIVEVNGFPTPDLTTFKAAVAGVPDRGSVRLRTIDLDGVEEVITMRLDLEYWPSSELLRTGGVWQRTVLSIPGSSNDEGEPVRKGAPVASP